MKKYIVHIFLLVVLNVNGKESPFNRLKLVHDSTLNFSFIVSGHFHGSSSNISGFPASSLQGNIGKINLLGAHFMVSTGDMFLDIRNDIPNYKKALFSRLTVPLFNVPGNHDYPKSVYEENFGKTYGHFFYKNCVFLLLDTEMDNGSLKGEQWQLFQDVILKCSGGNSIRNVFIFSHRPVWAEDDEELKNIFLENTKSTFKTNFETEVEPFLKKIKKKLNFYWFSGSLGGQAPASFFYHKSDERITYIQSAIRDLPHDAMLQVYVEKGNVRFETFSLNHNKAPELEECNREMWKRGPVEKPFNYRLIKLYMVNMLTHRYFWYGVCWTTVGIGLIWFCRKRRRKKLKV
ncbi:MAG: metallophosphoesterase family protein [Flavobacteriales bacterium]